MTNVGSTVSGYAQHRPTVSSNNMVSNYLLSICSHIMGFRLTLSDVCYRIIYPDRHNRSLKDPWSLRQLGVYNQISSDFNGSQWIFLDLAAHVESSLKKFIQENPQRSRLALHIELLVSLCPNWGGYIEFLNTELRDYVCC